MTRERYMFALTISKEKQEQIIKAASSMSEKQKRQFLASEAALLGYGHWSITYHDNSCNARIGKW